MDNDTCENISISNCAELHGSPAFPEQRNRVPQVRKDHVAIPHCHLNERVFLHVLCIEFNTYRLPRIHAIIREGLVDIGLDSAAFSFSK